MIELTGWRILLAPVLMVLIALTAATAGEPGAFASVAGMAFWTFCFFGGEQCYAQGAGG